MLIVAWKDISFEFRVMKEHSTKKMTTKVEFGGTNQGGQYKMEIQSYPKSDYMQLLVKQVFIGVNAASSTYFFNKFAKIVLFLDYSFDDRQLAARKFFTPCRWTGLQIYK